jgi:hypothetical protein
MKLRQSMAVPIVAMFTVVGTGMARAGWLDGAWSEGSARRNGHPAVSMSADAVYIVLPAASLHQAYQEGLTTQQALSAFLDQYGQRCSDLIDLNVPHANLRTMLSLQGSARFEEIAEGDAALAAAEKAHEPDAGIPLLFAVSPLKFEYRINYVPTRQVRCVAPAGDDATS